MKPEAQRIAIAEACGWKGPFTSDPRAEGVFLGGLPDYLTDLNAIHHAEQTMTAEQRSEYVEMLRSTTSPNGRYKLSASIMERHVFDVATATASRRAEAFLRTLNLWVEE